MKNTTHLPIIIIADNIRSLYNVGSLFRLGDGLAVTSIYLCGMTGHPKVENDTRPEWVIARAEKELQKTGLTGLQTVAWKYFEKTEQAVKEVRELNYQVIALEKNNQSIEYTAATFTFPLAVIIGHETEGVAENIVNLADLTVHLPMYGEGKSLNVSTAAAAFLYHLNTLYTKP